MKDIKATSAPPAEDPLGYDTSDPVAAIGQMAEDAVAGLDDDLVKAEANRFAALFGRRFRIVAGPEAFPDSVMERIRKLEDDEDGDR
jgi:hypothetical protein